ncbi:Transcriptional factor B3 family protein [Arabidopsis thaliana]|uniref:Putative B3 domain-containing protein REM15 n=2 Tax=Arabidopsis TaxID=3701 RepID=REM15_ARATH|nr:Transcriptional factor B3 family protein [Arabidopsis thaliana]O23076.2 RecName: Full=Putative B3 domain-containing protein REM15; AltName: Full=Protein REPRODUCTIVE MERISTEM 15 [Arabidopsis thaliana]AEE81847.1 Transcriptional factor B3 family protein [Arabidopsis thaliana]|eukprot:NP_567162.2 Transcriptional factor B3 family protein [Arabidopsis thaliana]
MAHQHFFKPLLPGFHASLTIPVAFFLKYIEGRYEQKTAKLRSDASKRTWEVKIDGQRLTDGWKEFAVSHDLRIGDIVVFRQESDLAFHVTLLGPSCCGIQYGSCSVEKNNLGDEKKKVKENPNGEAESSSRDPSCFVANVAPSSLRYDLMRFPRGFVRDNGVVGSGEIVLMNEKGRSWNFNLRQKPSNGTVYVRGGWVSFCDANGLKAGDNYTFKLIKRAGTLVLRLLPNEPKEEANEVSLPEEPESDAERNLEKIQRKEKVKKNVTREAESSSQDPSCFVANVSPSSLRYDTLYLPKRFMRENGVDKRCGEMILINEKGKSWTLDLKVKKSSGTSLIKRGWRSFCSANGLRAGSIITLKLIKKRATLVLRLIPNEPEEANEVVSLSTEQESDEESIHDEKISRRKSLLSENRFVTLTLTPYTIQSSLLNENLLCESMFQRLPVPFTRMNGINEETKMTLLDKHGVKWLTTLRFEDDKRKRLRMVGGWQGFIQANDVKANESIMLELIWEEETSCVLKFCSKVKLEIK